MPALLNQEEILVVFYTHSPKFSMTFLVFGSVGISWAQWGSKEEIKRFRKKKLHIEGLTDCEVYKNCHRFMLTLKQCFRKKS